MKSTRRGSNRVSVSGPTSQKALAGLLARVEMRLGIKTVAGAVPRFHSYAAAAWKKRARGASKRIEAGLMGETPEAARLFAALFWIEKYGIPPRSE